MSTKFEHDRTVEPVPPAAHQPYAGHHWLREYSYDGHSMQTLCLQWQPNAKKWCRSGEVATGRDIDTRGWQYLEPCPMPSDAVTRQITTDETNVWTALLPTQSEALEMQMKSMLYMQADQHYRKRMKRDEQKTWLAKNQIGDSFPKIDEVNIGQILVILMQFGLPVSVTVGD